jgi:CHAT domain-containing protein
VAGGFRGGAGGGRRGGSELIIHRARKLAALTLLAGCAIGVSPERAADLRALEAESAARLAAEGELLLHAEPITREDYKGRDGATGLLEAGELRRGIREASKALYLGRTAGPALVAMAKRDLAYAYSLAGDLDRAATYAQEAIAVAPAQADWFRPATPAQVLGPAHKILGDVRLRQRRIKEANAAYEDALRVSEATFVPFVRVSLANAQLADGNVVRARELFRQAESTGSPTVRALARRGLGHVALAERRYADAEKLFEAAAAQASGDDQAYERLWALDGLARARQGAGNRPGAIEAYRRAIASAEQVRARFRSEEFKTGFFGDIQRIFDSAVRLLMDAGQAEAALEVSERGRARALLDLLRGRGRAADGAQAFADPLGQPLTADRLRAAVPADSVLLAYHVVADRTYVWAVRRAGITATTLEVGREPLLAQARAFREAIRNRSTDTERLATALHARLLGPLALRRGEALIVVPHDVLHYVPFHALRPASGWLVEERAMTYAPSATAAARLATGTPRPRRQLLALGNPDVGSPRQALPAAQREVERLQALFSESEVHVRKAATKARLVSRAPDSQVIHVAAHADVDEIDPLYSKILLAPLDGKPGDLEAHEVYRLSLPRTSLVTLSACDTGLGRVSRGDELWGFTRSFLSAGAPTLLVSLWPVEDESTALGMVRFYDALRSGPSRDALRAAQLAVLRDSRTAHPFFWAPFILIGDGR